MRFPVEGIKAAISGSDRELRTDAAYYFAVCRSQDPSLMPLIIDVAERYGTSEAFSSYHFCDRLPQTLETVRWILHQSSQNLISPFTREAILFEADAELRKKLKGEFANATWMDEKARQQLEMMPDLSEKSADDLWRELEELTRREDAEIRSDKDDDEWDTDDDRDVGYFQQTEWLVCALSERSPALEERVLKALDVDPDCEGPEGLMLELAINLAGRWRMESAIPRLIELYKKIIEFTHAEWVENVCYQALIRIGSDSVVRNLAVRYPDFDAPTKISAAEVLMHISTDLCVRTLLDLYAEEKDPGCQARLLLAALQNFERDAIPLARDYVLAEPLDEDRLDVRSKLLSVCRITGDRFPEFDEWLVDSADDARYRQNLDAGGDFDDEYFDDEFDDEDDAWDDGPCDDDDDGEADNQQEFHPSTIVREEPRVGRNDPCPCGSGKKFKKCCYGKSR